MAEEHSLGRMVKIGGVERRMYTTGDLAVMLNRSTVTIRGWEQKGVLPKAVYRKRGKGQDIRGDRRLYTEEQVQGIVKIAREEGVLDSLTRPIKRTNFTPRVFALFKELAPKRR